MENPIKMDDLGGFPIIFGNTHVPFWRDYFPSFAQKQFSHFSQNHLGHLWTAEAMDFEKNRWGDGPQKWEPPERVNQKWTVLRSEVVKMLSNIKIC